MTVAKLKKFLDDNEVRYVSVEHSPAYTAQEIAKRAHIKGDQLAKTVIIDIDGDMAMVVLPASWRIRWDRFMNAMGTDFISLADEEEFIDRFPECEIGAMPALGKLFDMRVYMHEVLRDYDEIAFSAGSHSEIIKMSVKDYIRLTEPVLMNEGFVKPGASKPQWLSQKRAS
jgi:Ala-tRNA(Pro) deacylase